LYFLSVVVTPCHSVDVRLYAAVVPPAERVEDLFAALDAPHDPSLTWNPPGSVRIGLCNFGNLSHEDLVHLSSRLRTVAVETSPLAISFSGGAALEQEDEDFATVTVDGDLDDLRALALNMADSARRNGLLVDRRWYEPKAQIGRIHAATTAPELQRIVDRLEAYRGAAWTVTEVELVEPRFGHEPAASQAFDVIETLRLGR
jgi:2'-5' RNA ligase